MILVEVCEIVVHEDLPLPVLLQFKGDGVGIALARDRGVGAVEDGVGARAGTVAAQFLALGVVDLFVKNL